MNINQEDGTLPQESANFVFKTMLIVH